MLRLAAAFHLCGRGQISTGKAARLAGLSYAEFLEEAVRQKVDLYHYDLDEIKEEITRPLPSGVNLDAIKQSIARAQSAGSLRVTDYRLGEDRFPRPLASPERPRIGADNGGA